MSAEVNGFDPGVMAENLDGLGDNIYPGRGIVLGVTGGGDQEVQAYWVMGRSENSRNRILVEDEDGTVRTEAYDLDKVTDPSLIIYNAMVTPQSMPYIHLVSNGNHTDAVLHRQLTETSSGGSTFYSVFRDALVQQQFEPDEPNFTPRITGMMAGGRYDYSIIRRNPTTQMPEHTFGSGNIGDIPAGAGICFHTYEGDAPSPDEPIPAFEGSPYGIPLGADADEIAGTLWGTLDQDNKVALAVKTIDRQTGEIAIQILNKLPELATAEGGA